MPVRNFSDATGRPVVVDEGERLGMAHPALQRIGELVLQLLRDVDEGRRAGPAVQIFVAAPDGEFGAAPLRSSSIAPALCDRSQTTSAPAARAASLIAAMS